MPCVICVMNLEWMLALVRDYGAGRYRRVPWKTMAAIVGALAYFANPFDAVFDYIPLTGFLDDVIVLKLAIDLAREDLKAYRIWREKTPIVIDAEPQVG